METLTQFNSGLKLFITKRTVFIKFDHHISNDDIRIIDHNQKSL